VFNCTFAAYLFASCVVLHPLFFFLSDFAPHLVPPFSSFNDDFEQNTIAKMGCKITQKKKRGCKIAQLVKDWKEKCN